jgi:hypothetical protein
MSLFENSSNIYFNGSSATKAYLNGNVVWSLVTPTPTPTPTASRTIGEETQLLINPHFDLGTTGWTASGGFGTWSFTSSNQIAVLNSVLYFTYVSRTVSQSVDVSSYISSSDSFSSVLNIKREENGPNNNDTYNFTLLFKNSGGTTIATKTTGSSIAPLNYTDITLTLNRSEIPVTFDTITTVEVRITGQDLGNWNGNHGPWVDYVNLNVIGYSDLTPTPTATPTVTPTITSTPTPTPTSAANGQFIYNAQSGIAWNGYGSNFLSFGRSQDGLNKTPLAGWYFRDSNNVVRRLLNTPVWFSGGNPSPWPNGIGWIAVADGSFSISSSETTITFYETAPV